jgi:transposase InsO family protein
VPKQKFQLISSIKGDIVMLCNIANVSRSGYYKWNTLSKAKAKDYDDYLLIKEIFDRGKSKYGWRMIQMKLWSEKGIHMNHKKIQRIKNKYGLRTKIRRVSPYKAIMKKSQEHRTFDNLLDREFKQEIPLTILSTDITYVPFKNRFAYLSVVKDVASREVVSWYVSPHLQMDIVLKTLDTLKSNVGLDSLQNTLIHSDQGNHYTNPQFISTVSNLGMVQSMSRKGNCVDNAPIESFFGHFKDDIEYDDCKTFEELRLRIGEYMEYYNYERQQWNLKKMTPVEYRNHLLSK